ncbi:unnamed protein product [Arctia plantaginis]|uniref:Uncharacterized protein n=1 Tax=Arctia plantaginis TaxID=874455 RepID=A0A8S1AAP7_ARCPL|nr:unnamed protein product [Arctia plantaginis]CAB3243593.1 unnamed protein product [Arctia plantaginis]
MKFLVLALCVCAASAATFNQYRPYNVQNAAKVGASPFVASAKAVGYGSSQFASPSTAPVVNAQVSVAAAVPRPVAKTANSDAEAEVISNETQFNEDGSYNQQFETNNGISVQSSGVLKKFGDANALVVTGSYRYYTNDGTPVEVTYVADENGFQAKSDSLPVAPPVPEAIARSIEYLAKYAKPENQQY